MHKSVLLDFTHLDRAVTGIERVTIDLFNDDFLSGYDVTKVTSNNTANLVLNQWFNIPIALAKKRRTVMIFPGFPPSMFATYIGKGRAIMYVHDLFLIEKFETLNWRAKLYSAFPFLYAVKNFKNFFVNSEFTEQRLRAVCARDAKITLLRPPIPIRPLYRNKNTQNVIRILCLGTVEPRKNFVYAARIARGLEQSRNVEVILDIVGRRGWGPDWETLKAFPNVNLHGYSSEEEVSKLSANASIFLSPSLEEGIGLPLLEMQSRGLPVAASDIPIYHEVLRDSGMYFPLDNLEVAVREVSKAIDKSVLQRDNREGVNNVARWNRLSLQDREAANLHIESLF